MENQAVFSAHLSTAKKQFLRNQDNISWREVARRLKGNEVMGILLMLQLATECLVNGMYIAKMILKFHKKFSCNER